MQHLTYMKQLDYFTFLSVEYSLILVILSVIVNQITKLKIDSNPFAKGFRDSSRLTDYERHGK